MQRLPVVRHLSANQARAKYRSCRHPVEKTRWHTIWLLLRADAPAPRPRSRNWSACRSSPSEMSSTHWWNGHGSGGLADRRRGNGSKPRLTDGQRAGLPAAMKERPPDDGLWSGPKVAAYVRDRWGVMVWPQTG